MEYVNFHYKHFLTGTITFHADRDETVTRKYGRKEQLQAPETQLWVQNQKHPCYTPNTLESFVTQSKTIDTSSKDPVLVPAVWSYDAGDGGSVGQRGAALHYGSRGGAFRPAGDIGRSGCVASRCGCHPSDAATAECSVRWFPDPSYAWRRHGGDMARHGTTCLVCPATAT